MPEESPQFEALPLRSGASLTIPEQIARKPVPEVSQEESRRDRMVRLAVALQRIGVSERETFKLLTDFPLDSVEAQITWLPLRNPKKPASLIVTAIREDFEAPAADMPTPAKPSLEELLNQIAD